MAKLGSLNINIGDKVRACSKNSCGKYFSNFLSSCPHCGSTDYIAKVVTKDIEMDIERQR